MTLAEAEQIKKEMEKFTSMATTSQEAAIRVLINEGFLTEDGKIREEYDREIA